MGHNESEPHLMSLEKCRTGEKPSRCLIGEGRREEAGQQSEPSQRSGGVGVDGTSGSSIKVSWENSGGGPQAQPLAQAGQTSEAGGVVGEVGVPHSSVDLLGAATKRRGDGGGRRESCFHPRQPRRASTMARAAARGTQSQDVSAQSGAAGDDTQEQRRGTTVGHPDGQRQGGANGGVSGAEADRGGGLSSALIRISAQTPGASH